MADSMETTRNEGIPAAPPLQRLAPVVHMPDKGDGQSHQQVTCLGSGPPQLQPPPANSRAGRQHGFVNNKHWCNVIFREYSKRG